MSQETEMKLLQEIERLKRQVERLKVGEVGGSVVFLTTPLTSTAWDGDSFSTTAKTKIDLSDVFGAPAGIKAVLVHVALRDSASAASSSTKIVLAPNDTADLGIAFRSAGMPNDVNNADSTVVPCDENGDIYYQITASGTNTTDVWITIWGYWL